MALTGHVLSRKPFEVYCFDHSNHMGSSKQIYSRWRWVRAGKPCSNRLSSHGASKCCHICVGNQPETPGTSKWHHECCQHKHGSGHATSSLHLLAPFQPGISCHLPASKTQILTPTLLWLERRRLFMLSPKVEIWVQRGGEVKGGKFVDMEHLLCFTELRKQAHQYTAKCLYKFTPWNAATLLYRRC